MYQPKADRPLDEKRPDLSKDPFTSREAFSEVGRRRRHALTKLLRRQRTYGKIKSSMEKNPTYYCCNFGDSFCHLENDFCSVNSTSTSLVSLTVSNERG